MSLEKRVDAIEAILVTVLDEIVALKSVHPALNNWEPGKTTGQLRLAKHGDGQTMKLPTNAPVGTVVTCVKTTEKKWVQIES